MCECGHAVVLLGCFYGTQMSHGYVIYQGSAGVLCMCCVCVCHTIGQVVCGLYVCSVGDMNCELDTVTRAYKYRLGTHAVSMAQSAYVTGLPAAMLAVQSKRRGAVLSSRHLRLICTLVAACF